LYGDLRDLAKLLNASGAPQPEGVAGVKEVRFAEGRPLALSIHCGRQMAASPMSAMCQERNLGAAQEEDIAVQVSPAAAPAPNTVFPAKCSKCVPLFRLTVAKTGR
jgi:hypothetical protein